MNSLSVFVVLIFLGCASAPPTINKETRGYRHTPSQTIYPKAIGNYTFLENDVKQAITLDKKSPRRLKAVYLDYKSGGVMSSILYRPFAQVMTFPKPKKIKFEDFVDQKIKGLTANRQIIDDHNSRIEDGSLIREIKISSSEAFMSYNSADVSLNDKLPSVTKLIFIEKGQYVIFMKTAYPSSESALLAKPNSEFVDKFIKTQL